jgi:hypothetical protein
VMNRFFYLVRPVRNGERDGRAESSRKVFQQHFRVFMV